MELGNHYSTLILVETQIQYLFRQTQNYSEMKSICIYIFHNAHKTGLLHQVYRGRKREGKNLAVF